MMEKTHVWQIWIDTGGTFTDSIAVSPSGEMSRLKILSSGVMRVPILQANKKDLVVRLPLAVGRDVLRGYRVRIGTALRTVAANDEGCLSIDRALPIRKKYGNTGTLDLFTGEEVPVLATRLLTQTPMGASFPSIELKLGSTRGTNALLERKGARTALLVTKGFRDLLVIGNQQRSDLFALHIDKPELLYDKVLEIPERILASGNVLTRPDEDAIKHIISRLRRHRIESVAIALLNSYVNPQHERMLGDRLTAAGFQYVSMSHLLSRQLKVLPRAQTALVNAYLDPVIRNYLTRIQVQLGDAVIKIMSSAGGLMNIDSFYAKDSLLSGPAGGVVGALEKAGLSGHDHIITFDMGGTSTDVSRCDGKLDYQFECAVGNQRILSPSLAIETIAAGGGSICAFDGYQLCVGPQSAGAQPGPACYGMGGPLTITDVNLLLGRISPGHFTIPLNVTAANEVADALIKEVNAKGMRISKMELLQSFIDIANEKMADAMRKISVQKGHDPREYSLLCFGGAGGQHACALASLLEIGKIILPYDAGLLSAFGIGNAREEVVTEKLLLRPLEGFLPHLEKHFAELTLDAQYRLSSMVGQPGASINCDVVQMIFLRLSGQETSLEVRVSDVKRIVQEFKKRYKQVYGHYLPHRAIEIESIRVMVKTRGRERNLRRSQRMRYTPFPDSEVVMPDTGSVKRQSVFVWENLRAGAHIRGPALVISKNSTSFVADGWSFYLDANNNGIFEPAQARRHTTRSAAVANLALFTNRFTSLVEDMGSLLQRSSFSVNVKERLDFSCALLDAAGELIVNAPHIPVHLGSLGVCVRTVKRVLKFEPGDVVITNHPAFGGSHLPDITLIKPVFYARVLIGYVVNRAHHAEIGGKKPGSMPADGRVLEDEGVIIAPTYLVRKGVPQWQHIETLLRGARYPTRSPDENLADLNGGLAALTLGAHALEAMCRRHSRHKVCHYMKAIKAHAAALMHSRIQQLRRRYHALEFLDDGSRLNVTITRRKATLTIDFSGSSGIHPSNLNATTAIVNSVVLYVLRLLVAESMPLNEGLFKHVELSVPTGMLNPAFSSVAGSGNYNSKSDPAVVGGNTEVSQRLADTLLKAFGLAACSQGTMNNLLFGNERFGYYETICGGAGAIKGHHGADAVHTHMTNTRITDPEVLELKYPVRLEAFLVRRNSGGKGIWHGGDGVIRKFIFNDTLEVNILSQHRRVVPYGMRGGASGKAGRQYLVRDGRQILLQGIAGITVITGDMLVIETPGGGGWGKL